MKILMIGDVFGRIGRDMLFEYSERGFFGADAVIANIENAAHGRGVTKPVFDELLKTGVDAFTLGNHVWNCPDIVNVLRYNDNIIRPYNLEGDLSGSGTMVFKAKNGVRVGVLNLLGRVDVQPYSSNPFLAADRAIDSLKNKCDIIAVDFHAEATSEKQAMGYYLDGRVAVVAGTHTHVQTADEKILAKGTGYITDLGMTGPAVSILGMDKNIILDSFIKGYSKRFEPATGKGQLNAAMFEIDETSGKTVAVERINK
ncbi:MAG: TIGR00282 family metallophosphoesterase [Clostridia bacterium]|nr:TIGR00282 family metallophosphoesterase [Clostridia bacterium]